jgi:hypothetical protein
MRKTTTLPKTVSASLLVWQWAVYKDSGSERIVQLNLQDLLDNRRLEAEEPSLGFGSAITKERKQMNTIKLLDAAVSRILSALGRITNSCPYQKLGSH